MLLLIFNVFNRMAATFTGSEGVTFEDDWETKSPLAASGARLLAAEANNHAQGRPPGLTIAASGAVLVHICHRIAATFSSYIMIPSIETCTLPLGSSW